MNEQLINKQASHLPLLLQLLHVLNQALVLPEFKLVVFDRDLTLGLKKSLGELEVLLLNVLNLSLSNDQVKTLGSERLQSD